MVLNSYAISLILYNKQVRIKMNDIISKINYEMYSKIILSVLKEIKESEKKIVIFGAGIIGGQVSALLNRLNFFDYFFCDNNSEICNKKIDNHIVISTDELKQLLPNVYVFLAMERYEKCLKQLNDYGFELFKNLLIFKNYDETELIKNINCLKNVEEIYFGDCSLINISLNDTIKMSLAELIEEKFNRKVLALNGIYIRQIYNVILKLLSVDNSFKTFTFLFGMEVFNNYYHTIPSNQHLDFWTEIFNQSDLRIVEKDFFDMLKKRSYSKKVINKKNNLNTCNNIAARQYINLRANYMLDIDPENENLQYISKICEFCNKNNVKIKFVFFPMNYETSNRLTNNRFSYIFEKNKNIIINKLSTFEVEILDLSNLLNENQFIIQDYVNKGIKYDGKITIIKKLFKG